MFLKNMNSFSKTYFNTHEECILVFELWIEDFFHFDINSPCEMGDQGKSNILIFPFQETDHATDMVSRAIKDSKTPEEMQQMVEDAQLPIEQKKRKIQRNLRTLEQMGLVSSKNKYQDILNEIAKVFGNSILSSLSRCLLIIGHMPGDQWGDKRDSWLYTQWSIWQDF